MERRVKEQSGKSVAELVDADSSAKATATATAWKEFDKLTPRNPKTQQALSFTTRGIKLGDALSEVKKCLPGIQAMVSTNSISSDNVETEGIWVAKRVQGLQDAEFVRVTLRGGRVKRMHITYYQEDANKLGGWHAILNGLKEKFGETDADSRGVGKYKGYEYANYKWKISDSFGSVQFLYYAGPRWFVTVSAEYTAPDRPTSKGSTTPITTSSAAISPTPSAKTGTTVSGTGWEAFDKFSPSDSQIGQALNYTVKGVKLGDTIGDVKKNMPKIRPVVDPKHRSQVATETQGSWRFTREQGLQGASFVRFDLRDGRVSELAIIYEPSDAEKLGGWEGILSDLKGKFGEPSPESSSVKKLNYTNAEYDWPLPDSFGLVKLVYVEGPRYFLGVYARYTRF